MTSQPSLPRMCGEDRGGAAVGVVDDDLGGAGADRLLVDEAQDALLVVLDVVFGEAQASGVLHLRPSEILPEEEALDPLLAIGRDVHPPLVEELDVHQLRVVGRPPDVHPGHRSVLAHLIADHGNGGHPEVVHVHPGREQAADDGPVDQAAGPVRVPAGADDGVLPQRGAEGRPQLGGELRRDLDVAQARDAVRAEERARPPVPPDQAGGEDGPVLHQLLGPDLDVGLDHRALADAAGVADERPLEEAGARLDLAAAGRPRSRSRPPRRRC